MDRKRRILIVSFLNCIPEKCIGRQERQEPGKGLRFESYSSIFLTVSIHEDITTHGGKGRNFLSRWKEEDLNYNKSPLLYRQEGEAATVAMQMKGKITTVIILSGGQY